MGMLSAIVSMIFAGVSTYLYKRCSPLLGPTNTTFFYYLSGFIISLLVWVFVKERSYVSPKDLVWPFFTALSLFISIWTFNYSLQTIDVSIASPVRSMSFVITAVLAVWISHEKLYLKDYLAMLLAVSAILIFSISPPSDKESISNNENKSSD